MTTKIYKSMGVEENHKNINSFVKAVIINFGDERGDIIVKNDKIMVIIIIDIFLQNGGSTCEVLHNSQASPKRWDFCRIDCRKVGVTLAFRVSWQFEP